MAASVQQRPGGSREGTGYDSPRQAGMTYLQGSTPGKPRPSTTDDGASPRRQVKFALPIRGIDAGILFCAVRVFAAKKSARFHWC